MSFVTAALAATEHASLPMPTLVYGAIALVIFIALGFVVWTYRDVAHRHLSKAEAYAAANRGAGSHDGH